MTRRFIGSAISPEPMEFRVASGVLILFPTAAGPGGRDGGEYCSRERLGGLLRLYHRDAA